DRGRAGQDDGTGAAGRAGRREQLGGTDVHRTEEDRCGGVVRGRRLAGRVGQGDGPRLGRRRGGSRRGRIVDERDRATQGQVTHAIRRHDRPTNASKLAKEGGRRVGGPTSGHRGYARIAGGASGDAGAGRWRLRETADLTHVGDGSLAGLRDGR